MHAAEVQHQLSLNIEIKAIGKSGERKAFK
jgi:hypothetical protein